MLCSIISKLSWARPVAGIATSQLSLGCLGAGVVNTMCAGFPFPAMPALTLPLCVPYAYKEALHSSGDIVLRNAGREKEMIEKKSGYQSSPRCRKKPPPPPSSSKLKWTAFVVATSLIIGIAYRKYTR